MSILLLFSKLVYRNNDTYTSLSLALLILLVYNPFLINNLGLQLSFGGVLGIVLLNKNVSELLKIKKFKDVISISISVQLFILPIVLSQSNIFNPYFLISNLLLSIIVGPIVILGFIYITWWCDEKDRNKFKSVIQSDNSKIEKTEKIENYNIDDIFKNKKELKSNVITQDIAKEETSMIEYKEENIFKKIINKILSFFTNKKERS